MPKILFSIHTQLYNTLKSLNNKLFIFQNNVDKYNRFKLKEGELKVKISNLKLLLLLL